MGYWLECLTETTLWVSMAEIIAKQSSQSSYSAKTKLLALLGMKYQEGLPPNKRAKDCKFSHIWQVIITGDQSSSPKKETFLKPPLLISCSEDFNLS